MDMSVNKNDIEEYRDLYYNEYNMKKRKRVSCMLPIIPGTNKLSKYLSCKIDKNGKTSLYVVEKPNIMKLSNN